MICSVKPAKTLLYSPGMLELRKHIIDDIDWEKKSKLGEQNEGAGSAGENGEKGVSMRLKTEQAWLAEQASLTSCYFSRMHISKYTFIDLDFITF